MLTVQLDGTDRVKPADRLSVALPPAACHLFDPGGVEQADRRTFEEVA
jgi:hypothetical protein